MESIEPWESNPQLPRVWCGAPAKFEWNNFTPLARTPWAGDGVVRQLKQHLGPCPELVGESWEFSPGVEFPSTFAGTQVRLCEIAKKYSKEVFGSAEPSDQILVKLLHANSPLSLQIHPDDFYANLDSQSCGKPESWLVVDAKEGSQIYLGFRHKMSKSSLQAKLEGGADLENLLQEVPVQKGDYFEIPAGVPHALGAGVLLLEPQRLVDGKKGKTYRMWDWGRKFDEQGRLSPNGRGRELHIKESVDLCDPEKQFGLDFVNSLKKAPQTIKLAETSRKMSFSQNDWYQTHLIQQDNLLCEVEVEGSYMVLVYLSGSGVISSAGHPSLKVQKGECALLPAIGKKFQIKCSAKSEYAIIHPSKNNFLMKRC